MIKPGEIQKKARAESVRDQQIEKDYVLSWILQGIAWNENLSNIIVFKGGTVLKKVYFEDYRFSEDLDFTLLDDSVSNEWIFMHFNKAFAYIKEKANIPLVITHNTEHEDGGINFYINYTGPLGGLGANKKVKVDISRNEQLQFEPIWKNLFLCYSDQEKHKLLCYSPEEILVEKLRSVMQRMQARDFYDIWHLLEEYGLEVDQYINEFIKKCKYKGLDPKNILNKLEHRIPQYKARWRKTMKGQIQALPEFDMVEREVMRHIKKLKF